CAYYRYDDNIYLVTHGGLSRIPDNLSLVATDQMINGVGGYKEAENVAKTFCDVMANNIYQVHGHRNVKSLPIQVYERVFNLEDHVEFGGNLRCIQVRHDGIHTFEIKNNVFKNPDEVMRQK